MFVGWMSAELAVFEELSRGSVEDGACQRRWSGVFGVILGAFGVVAVVVIVCQGREGVVRACSGAFRNRLRWRRLHWWALAIWHRGPL